MTSDKVEIYSPKYSGGFAILADDSISKNIVIAISNPWQGAVKDYSELRIQQDNMNIDRYPYQSLKGEAKRIVCMSSTHIAMLEALGESHRIVGVSGKQYISNSKIRNNEDIKDIGYEGNIDYETLVALQPDLVLLFSVNGASSMEPRLKSLGIPFIYIGDYVENSPLGKSEWIIPIAETVGKRNEGIQKFQQIEYHYHQLKNKVAETIEEKPKVMVNAPFGESWFTPSADSYIAEMIRDAGAEYVYKINSGNASLPIDMETALELVSEADFWINIGSVKNLNEVKKNFPKFKNTKCVELGNLYNNNLRSNSGGGNDCYETGALYQDSVLQDMIKIFHPELIPENFVFYHKIQ